MNSEQIEAAAARWFWKRDGETWSEADQAELDSWLRRSTANRIAYLRLSAGWKRAARMKALGAGIRAGVIPPPGEWGDVRFPGSTAPSLPITSTPVPFARSIKKAGLRGLAAVAATVLLTVVALHVTDFRGTRYSTPVGGLDTVPLADGSRITLNTDTRIHVDLSNTERHVDLDRGEAFFEVAKDPARPFVVQVGDRRIVAVGTQFSVRREGNDVRVAVTEGKVQLGERILAAGTVVMAANKQLLVREKTQVEAAQLLSWRRGFLVFEATPLAAAVAEFNRYNERKIFIADPSIAALRLGGNFRATNTEAFLWLLQSGFPIDVEQTRDKIVLRATEDRGAAPQ